MVYIFYIGRNIRSSRGKTLAPLIILLTDIYIYLTDIYIGRKGVELLPQPVYLCVCVYVFLSPRFFYAENEVLYPRCNGGGGGVYMDEGFAVAIAHICYRF